MWEGDRGPGRARAGLRGEAPEHASGSIGFTSLLTAPQSRPSADLAGPAGCTNTTTFSQGRSATLFWCTLWPSVHMRIEWPPRAGGGGSGGGHVLRDSKHSPPPAGDRIGGGMTIVLRDSNHLRRTPGIRAGDMFCEAENTKILDG